MHCQAAGRIFNWLLLCCLSFFLLACNEKDPRIFRFGLSSAVISLDPRFTTDAISARLNRLIYQHLVDFDDRYQPVPSIANWETISPRQYRFRLLENRGHFPNGAVLTARDVKKTYDYILDPANASPHRSSLKLIREIRLVDDRTLDFFLKREDPMFPAYLVIGILPANIIDSGIKLDHKPRGSGAFSFVDWPEDGVVRLKRRSDQKIFEFIHVPDATVRVLKLLRGEIDLLQNDLPRELVHYLESRKQVHLGHRSGSNFTYLGFNMEDPVLSQHDIRLAIAHAIDRKSIIHHLFGGETRLAEALLPPEHWAGNPSLKGPRYDPVRAMDLLKKHGYGKDHPLVLNYKTTSDPFRVRIATILQDQLARVGVQVKLQSYDWATFYGDIKAGRFQMYTLSWVGIKSPDIFRYVFHSDSIPPAGANRGRYRDVQSDHLIVQAENAVNFSESGALYRALQQRILVTLPYVPLWYEEHFYAASNRVSGYTLATDGNYDALQWVQKQP